MRKNNGITLIALVVTIVVLLILAGITIQLLFGENSIFENAQKSAEAHKKAQVEEKFIVALTNLQVKKYPIGEKITIEDYFEQLKKEDIIADDTIGGDNIKEIEAHKEENKRYEVTTEEGEVVEVEITPEGKVEVEYQGTTDKMPPNIKEIKVTNKTSNSIDIEITVKRLEEGTISYYYKKEDEIEYHELKNKVNTKDLTAQFTGLEQGRIYNIKVVAKSKQGKHELVINALTGELAKGTISQKGETIWANEKGSIEVETSETGLTMQYQIGSIDEDKWLPYEGKIENLNHGDTVYVRLWDGTNGSEETTIAIRDGQLPTATITELAESAKTGKNVTATVTNTDNQSGINISQCKWVFTTSSEKIGTDVSYYTGGTFSSNSQKITWTPETVGTYYLHVLSVDKAGNKAETVSSGVVVEAEPTVHPIEGGTANADTVVTTSFGKIDIIWLDGTTNKPSRTQTPNSPANYLNGMTPVKWNGTTETPTTVTDADWYSYNEATGTTDSKSSYWANAKTSNGSYFVWIPRYAYRITYYDKNPNTDSTAAVTGYYDGFGMWNIDGQLKYELESGVETVNYGDYSYIVHPAFTTSLDMGGWSTNLPGFWFAKFEMSGSSSEALASVPGVASYRQQTIGTFYTTARSATYGMTGTQDPDDNNTTSFMYSHMAKNSEWGACAYLTHSKYGRNGYEIGFSNRSYYTGGGSETISYTETNKQLQSTTGNVYGIYDMRGGSNEFVAAFDKNECWDISCGSSFAAQNGSSTKYATAYENGTNTYYGSPTVYNVCKTGDGIKEVWVTDRFGWNNDTSTFCEWRDPFFARGGACGNIEKTTGVFTSGESSGSVDLYGGFRAVLCP